MNVVEISAYGAPEVLRIAQRERPRPGPGEILIRVRASGINRPDILQRKGYYAPPPGVSDILGLEVAGVIEGGDAWAMEQAGLALNDRVCALLAGGGYAEYCLAPVEQCLKVPDGLSDIEAASLPEACFTVWSNLFDRGALQPDEFVLVHGGSSGIGVTAIQMAKAWGARVGVTAGSQDKLEACKMLGAECLIHYPTQDFVEATLAWTQGRGADVILDMVAGDYIQRDLACLAKEGRLILIAVQGGARTQFDAAQLMLRRLTITGSTLRPRPLTFKSSIARSLRRVVWPWIESGIFKPVVFRQYPAAEVVSAHRLMESHEHIGKLVLTW